MKTKRMRSELTINRRDFLRLMGLSGIAFALGHFRSPLQPRAVDFKRIILSKMPLLLLMDTQSIYDPRNGLILGWVKLTDQDITITNDYEISIEPALIPITYEGYWDKVGLDHLGEPPLWRPVKPQKPPWPMYPGDSVELEWRIELHDDDHWSKLKSV